MAATITAPMKRRFIDEFKNDADSASVRYFIGIARSEDWNDSDAAPTPLNTEKEERDFRHGLQSVKQVADYSFVIPRVNWSAGTTFGAYNDQQVAHPTVPYYAMTESNQVYVCLKAGTNTAGASVPSTVQPTGSAVTSFSTADGYGWKFLYTVGTLDAAAYKSANFIPVKLQGATTGESPATDVEQLTIQTAADSGREVVGFALDSGGAGYSSAPTVTITGNGTGCAATATVSGGAVTKITLNDSSNGALKMGVGYDFASVALSGGGSPTKVATAKINLGPKTGFGADPRNDLRARAIMFNAKPVGTEEGEFIVDNSFRQIGLLRNPLQPDSAIAGSAFTASDGNALRRLQLASISTAFTLRSTITGGTSGAKAFIDKTDSDEIWYHQTETTGFIQFQENEAVTDAAGGAGTTQATGTDADDDAFVKPKVDKYSGDLLYIENRAAVTRAADQTEDIKVIIEI
jgi:hypothetical protein|tara:strand:- start:468 stop:1853 length:1386 start_codon:yes stop_codon:yes gene_type:complete